MRTREMTHVAMAKNESSGNARNRVALADLVGRSKLTVASSPSTLLPFRRMGTRGQKDHGQGAIAGSLGINK